MPKNTKAAGASYDGLVDVSPADVIVPDWTPAPEPAPQPTPVVKATRRKRGDK